MSHLLPPRALETGAEAKNSGGGRVIAHTASLSFTDTLTVMALRKC